MKNLSLVICFLIAAAVSQANIILPSIINNNMVLQQKDSVKLWGWSDVGEIVWVTTSWDNHTYHATGTPEANWQLNIKTPAAGGPFKITFRGNNIITLKNVMIGEVWICSGQSNMQMSYSWGIPQMKSDFESSYNNNIRFFQIPVKSSADQQDDCPGEWAVCDTNSLKTFSAAAYYFGKKLNHDMNIPIGLINSSWNGTCAEVWMPAAIVNKIQAIKEDAATIKPNPDCPIKPGVVYNAMIFPLINFKTKGVIWYQGEANVDNPGVYSKVLSTLINAWRNDRDEQLPFYYVQIAPYTYGNNLNAAVLREQQEEVITVPNTGMVVTTDLVDDTTNIHPKDKKDVGIRLANWALAKTYNKSNVVYASPMYKSMEIKNTEAIISFKFNSSGLMFTGNKVTEIYIAGNDKIFYPANAKIADKNLVVWSDNVKNPVAVRYAFGNASIGNLFSNNGLPVAPFRTDSWATDQQVSIAYDSH